jgi:hypothetical protein
MTSLALALRSALRRVDVLLDRLFDRELVPVTDPNDFRFRFGHQCHRCGAHMVFTQYIDGRVTVTKEEDAP